MASQNLNVGTTANSNDGDTLRAAFVSVKKMFAEIYGQTYSEQGDLSGTAFKIKANKLQMTADAVAGDDGKVLTYDHASGSFTWETKFDGDITEIVAGNGLTGDATSGTSSLAVGAGTGITVNDDTVQISSGGVGATQLAASAVTTTKINNSAVTHAKLANRFTAEVAISTLTGTVNYDCSLGSSFKLSGDVTGAYTINLTNYKIGQIITIYPLKGDFGVYLTAGTGTGVFNKLSEVDYDGTVDNILQIECVDDQATTPVFFYSVATFAAGATI